MDHTKHLYVSGVHGSGKSTLISDLCDALPNYESSERPPLPTCSDPYERNKLRMTRYFQQTFCAQQRAQETGKVQVWDRCAVDNLAYAKGFLAIDWISHEQYETIERLFSNLFIPDREPQQLIFLDPSIAFVEKNIRSRWEKTDHKKWREEEFEYTRAVHQAFREIYADYGLDHDVLRVMIEERTSRLEQVLDWIQKRK